MTVTDVIARLQAQDQVLILTHRRPDGDTIGCAVGLCETLRAAGKTAWVLDNPDATKLFTPYLSGHIAPADFKPEYVVSVDIATLGLLGENAKGYGARGIDLAIDHHPSNEGFAKENYVEADKASCGEILYKIAIGLGELTPAIALPLYMAVSTDTGCFVYGNTTPNTHRVAAELMAVGIPYQALNKRHFRTKSFKRLQVEALLMDGMHLYDGGLIAVAALSLEMMASLDAHEEDVEDIAAF
ncbi:MAG: DHH family phosphoesterase, partial [Oscillospiraceae bacterium]